MHKLNTVILCFIGLFIFSCSQQKQSVVEEETALEPSMELADSLAKKFIIVDGHVDLPFRLVTQMFRFKKILEDVSQRTEKGNFDYVRAKEGGLDAPFMSIYIPSSRQLNGTAKSLADSLINIIEDITTKHPDKFALAKTPEEVEENFKKGIISMPMGMENGAPIMDDIANVGYFYERGIRYITLTHSKDNQICDSSYDSTYKWNGLSPFGEEVVAEMNNVGIMVDVSHISDSAFYDVMKITKAPVIASHSSCRKYTPGFQRNMNDEMIKVMGENGGVIQINFGSTFIDGELQAKSKANRAKVRAYMKENNLEYGDSLVTAFIAEVNSENPPYSTVQKVADHIDHVVSLVGVDHVGFGSDFDGVGDSLPVGLKDVSQYPNLIFELLKRGYSPEDIEKICYKNVFRVWKEVQNVAAAS
ncbi:dipeptidase [Flexithrix dorotheae]|uniref:dipeptidase n=1 Tax=Flexithrix dorotheae TaxID=70993 RepID=UPI000376C269|nr:dipeptidase [Flexithrix dorotheae]